MKRFIILMAAVVLSACSQTKKPAPGNTKHAACKYTCVMDTSVCEDKPGVCPKCGMKLVEKD